MNRLLEMEIFAAIVDAGGISAAAERLHMAKSAVSKRLSALESRLGVTLLNRTTRRLSLTNAGSEFYGHCERILNEVSAAESSVAETDRTPRGHIRMAVPLSFGLDHVGPAVEDFLRALPDISVDLDFNDRRVDLLEEGFDLAVRLARLSDSSLVARRLTPIRHVVCASPHYWDTHGRPAVPDDLTGHVGLRYTLAAQRSWSYVAPDGSRGSVSVAPRVSANNGSFLALAATSGLGVTCLPVFIVYRLLASGELESVLTDHQWSEIHAWAVYPRQRHLPFRVRALIDHLASAFGDTPYWEKPLRRNASDARRGGGRRM